MSERRERQRLQKGISGKWYGLGNVMIVGSLGRRLGNRVLTNWAEEQGASRSLLRDNAGKAGSGYAAGVFEYQTGYFDYMPLGGEWSQILLHFFLYLQDYLSSRDPRHVTFILYPLPQLKYVLSLFWAFSNLLLSIDSLNPAPKPQTLVSFQDSVYCFSQKAFWIETNLVAVVVERPFCKASSLTSIFRTKTRLKIRKPR